VKMVPNWARRRLFPIGARIRIMRYPFLDR
jgi:hypothetical protein